MTDHNSRSSADRVQTLLAEQAAQWLVRIAETGGTAAERIELASWLKASPAHVMEFLKARVVWEALGGTALARWPEVDEVVAQAGGGEVVPLRSGIGNSGASPPARVPVRTQRVPGRWNRGFRLAAAAAVLACVVAGAWWSGLRLADPAHATYATVAGDQAAHLLPDGSSAVLNTRSRVRLDFSEHARDVYLDEGEALFEVAHDAERPFRVWAGDTMVRAVGTRFNVYRKNDGVLVTVLEGRVEAMSGAAAPDHTDDERVQLGAGERAHLSANAAIFTERLEQPERSIDWRSRRLVFEQAPLAEVIAEFNRYNEVPLELASVDLAAKHINGIFDAGDRASLVRFLQEFEQVEVETRDGKLLLRRRE